MPVLRARTPSTPAPIAVLASLLAMTAGTAARAVGVDPRGGLDDARGGARGAHVLDGSYVMNVGELQVNITNHGLIGSQYSVVSTYADAPSGQWPAGSGNEYLWSAGLWVGGVLDGARRVSTGQYEREFRPLDRPRDTVYEARDGMIARPPGGPAGVCGRRFPELRPDDDGDGVIDEETLDGYDNDGDGLVDEDFAQLGRQMMVCTTYDNTALADEIYPDHVPLNLKVVQTTFAWDAPEYRDFVGIRFEVTNIGTSPISDLYIGMLVDCDIGPRGRGDAAKDDAAGSFSGLAQAGDGTFWPVNVAYMRDLAQTDPLPGWFGCLLLDAPGALDDGLRSFQSFASQRPYEFGGDPYDDTGRYALMSVDQIDPDTQTAEGYDYHFLVSVGPWLYLAPGRTVQLDCALVVQGGRQELLRACADAISAWHGDFFDLDGDPETGIRGRETRLCFPELPPHGSSIYQQSADFMNFSCVGPDVVFQPIDDGDFEIMPDGSACIWVNLDNCQECDRLAGAHCTRDDRLFENYWNCNRLYLPALQQIGCTGVRGAESRVPWIVQRNAPPPPPLRVVPGDHRASVLWRDDSEHAIDPLLQLADFESYRVWRSDNWSRPAGTSLANGPPSASWRLIDEFDLVNDALVQRTLADGTVLTETHPLGRNTGLEPIAYRPACLDDARFAGLAAAMQRVVDRDTLGAWAALPPVRDAYGRPVPGLEDLLPWEAHAAVLDTFFAVTARAADPARRVVAKRAARFYEYVDDGIFNGFVYFYSVTATDHRLTWVDGPVPTGEGFGGEPSASFTNVTPGVPALDPEARRRTGSEVYVYPNPATREALDEFQRFHPNSDDPTGVRVAFANLPRCVSHVRIFTEDGDLVQELWHDGERGTGEASWNLVSRSGQEVASGIYLFTVDPQDSRFPRYTGRFVVVR